MSLSICDYEYHHGYADFKCEMPVHSHGARQCIFHDINYLKGDNYDKNKEIVAKEFRQKLAEYSSDEKHTFFKFVGYCLPEIPFLNYKFTKPVYFIKAIFSGPALFSNVEFPREVTEVRSSHTNFSHAAENFHEDEPANHYRIKVLTKWASDTESFRANFSEAKFYDEVQFSKAEFPLGAIFSETTFLNRAYFSGAFNSSTHFNQVIFEEPSKVTFDLHDMSKVSFANSDITRVRFTDKVTWGGNDEFTVLEEEWLKGRGQLTSLDLVLSVYRNLRENYEFRLRYDEAGRFFKKEMELKRKYRTVHLENNEDSLSRDLVKKNNWFRRHFSLTGLYYHFSDYGESIVKPTIIGAITIGLSTLFWIMQSKPTLEPHFFVNSSNSLYNSASYFIYLNQALLIGLRLLKEVLQIFFPYFHCLVISKSE
jgi:uncharacterized protein YjbI with pentapeptide repeats